MRVERWSRAVVASHWVSAAFLAPVFALGLAATSAAFDAARKFDLYQTHKALGWLTLALLAARLVARALRSPPDPRPEWSPLTRLGARIVHSALYFLLLATPLLGWLRVSTAIVPVPVSLFGFATIPNIAPMNPGLSETLATAHFLCAWALAALVALHACAAIKHRFVDRDATLSRILWR
jgi:cytochrome b561